MRVLDGREDYGDWDQTPIFSYPHCFKSLDGFVPVELIDIVREFLNPLGRKQDLDVLPDYFLGGIAPKPLRAGVPTENDPIEADSDNAVLRRLHNRRQECRCILRVLPFGDVETMAHDVQRLARRSAQHPEFIPHPAILAARGAET